MVLNSYTRMLASPDSEAAVLVSHTLFLGVAVEAKPAVQTKDTFLISQLDEGGHDAPRINTL